MIQKAINVAVVLVGTVGLGGEGGGRRTGRTAAKRKDGGEA